MSSPKFHAHPDCKACPLHEHADCVGMATRPIAHTPPSPLNRKALLILGAYPGIEEDHQWMPFVGDTGRITTNLYVGACELDHFADIYLSNGVRCYPRDRESATLPMYKKCLSWLEEDIRELARHYSEVVLLLTGAKVIEAVLGSGASLARAPQNAKVTIAGVSCTVFCTYLAAALRHDPSKAIAVKAHLLLLREYLETGELTVALHPEPAPFGSEAPDPPADADILALDIETYGAVEGLPVQTVFQPDKSIHVDGVAVGDLVQCIGAAWDDPDTGELTSKLYRPWVGYDMLRLQTVLETHTGILLGQNFPFDLMYMRHAPLFLAAALSPPRLIADLMVINFLECDQRPERSLKPVSKVLSIANYEDCRRDLSKGDRYPSRDDPDLWAYCCFDARVTLTDARLLIDRLGPRWNPENVKWYSDLLWLGVEMSEAGIQFDTAKLQALSDKTATRMEKIRVAARDNLGLFVSGKGSRDSRVSAVRNSLVDAGLWNDRRVALTKVHKRVSAGKDNINLVLDNTPLRHPARRNVQVIRAFTQAQDLQSDYLLPLLTGSADVKGHLKNPHDKLGPDGIGHPTCNIVPSPHNKQTEEIGGTKQGRITFRGPAIQKFSPTIKDCIVSRWEGGSILWIDMSQIELRIAASWSGDPEMLRLFREGRNFHLETASHFAGRALDKEEDHVAYHAGKQTNFCKLFLGGDLKTQATIRQKARLEVPMPLIQQFSSAFDRLFKVFREWQNFYIDKTIRLGYTELPVTGARRTFYGSERAVRAAYTTEIVNFPVQGVAANITLSAQTTVQEFLRAENYQTCCIGNVYDCGVYDAPAHEFNVMFEMLPMFFRQPPILAKLWEAGLHEVPVECEVKVTT